MTRHVRKKFIEKKEQIISLETMEKGVLKLATSACKGGIDICN